MLFLNVEILFLIACMLKCANGGTFKEELKKVQSAEGKEIVNKILENFIMEKRDSSPVFDDNWFYSFIKDLMNGEPLKIRVKISQLKLNDVEMNPEEKFGDNVIVH